MKVIANRQLHGSYGTLFADEECDMDHETATALLKSGLVRKPVEAPVKPVIEKSTKVLENKGK